MTDYLDFPKDTCPNISAPCWIPQIDNILPMETTSRLSQCNTMEEYICMLFTVMKSRTNVKKRCIKSCRAENYNVLSRIGSLEPFTKVCSKHSTILDCRMSPGYGKWAALVSAAHSAPFFHIRVTFCNRELYTSYRNRNKNPQDGQHYWNILLKLKLDSYTVFKYRETEFNDVISIVASVGGSLSLFLGFSCYQLGKKLINQYLS